MEVDEDLPLHVKYWLAATSKYDCFFVFRSELEHTTRIGAIKLFLIAHSEPLHNMLESSEWAKEEIPIVDSEPETFWTFLKCIYGGSDIVIPKLSFEESLSLLNLIEKYLVVEIKPKVVSHIEQLLPLSIDNIFHAASNPNFFQGEALENVFYNNIQLKGKDILTSDKFLQISGQGLLQILKAECYFESEPSIWDAVLKWAKHTTGSTDEEVMRKTMLPYLGFIRLCTFGAEQFCKTVVPTGILTCEEVNEICKYFGTGIAPKLEYVCNSTAPRTMAVPKTTFYYIESLNDIHNDKQSKDFNFLNSSWHILVGIQNNTLKVKLCCNTGFNQPISVVAEMVLVNQQNKPNFSKSVKLSFTDQIFKHTRISQGFDPFYPWNDLIKISNGFIKNNTIIIMVNLISDKE